MGDKEIVDKIRAQFIAEYQRNGQLYHEIDVNKVKADDWEIQRFVTEWNRSEDKAYEWLIKSLKWRKSYGVHDRCDQYFPIEFYRLGDKECTGRDGEGRLVQWECYRNDRTIAGFLELQKQFMAHVVDRVDSRVGSDGYTLVSDISGAGLRNVNYELMRFRIQLMAYYPQALRRIVVVDLPAVLNAFTRLVLTLVSTHIKKRIKFISRSELTEFVAEDAIPVRLGGRRQEMGFPQELQPLSGLKHLGLSDDEIRKYYKVYDNVL